MVAEQMTPLGITQPAVRAISRQLSDRARESERLGTMPPDLVTAAREAGLFHLAAPRLLGGAELPPASIVEALEECCRADGSGGWTVAIGNGTAFLAWLDPAVAVELLGRRTDSLSTCAFAPTGRLTPTGPKEFRLYGKWAFSSGSLHADWFINGGFVMDGQAPRMLPGRGPDWRLSVFPAADGSVLDNWDVAGLRGTGSHDVTATAVNIPEELTMAPFFEPARHDGPLWRFPFFTLVGVFLVSFPLGVARRALDEFAQLAVTKIRPPGQLAISEDADLQVALTKAEGDLQAARAFVFDTIGSMWDSALASNVPAVDQRARFLLAAQQAMHASINAVDTAFGFAGAGAIQLDHPLQRCFRDIHTAAQHIYFSPAAAKRYAKARLNIEQPTFMF
jgi:alkylation response protein AidB-like acyl-CoA dehydrogenase